MSVVAADSVSIGMVAETVRGVTPANPAFDLWRISSEGLTFSPNVSESTELGSGGRFARPSNVTGISVSGTLDGELAKFPAFEKALASVFAGEYGVCPVSPTGSAGGAIDTVNRITVGKTVQTYTIEKRIANSNFVSGTMPITATPSTPAPATTVEITFAGAASTGTGVAVITLEIVVGKPYVYAVPIVVGADAAAVAAAAVAMINGEGVFTATDEGGGVVSIVEPGSATINTLTIATGSDEYYYQRYAGVTFSTLSISASPNNPITYSFGTVGGVPTLNYLPLTGATYISAGDSAIFTAPEILRLDIGQSLAVGTQCWTEMTINADSGNRGIQCLGSRGDREVVLGTMAMTVSGTVYFSDQSILDAVLNNKTMGDGVFTFTNADGDVYRFDLYGLKPTSGELTAGGQGQDLTIPVEFTPTPVVVCDDGSGNEWSSGAIFSLVDTAPTLP